MMKYRCFAREEMTGEFAKTRYDRCLRHDDTQISRCGVRNGFLSLLNGGWIFSKCFRATLRKTDYGFNCYLRNDFEVFRQRGLEIVYIISLFMLA